MTAVVIVIPLVVGGCFAITAPAVARRLPPRHATWLLSAGSVIAALCAVAVLCLLGAVLVAQIPDIANEGHWSPSALRANAPTEPGVGALSLLGALAAAGAVVFMAVRRGAAVLGAYRACKEMTAHDGNLVVVSEAPAGAIAVPGRPGRIVIAQSLLAALTGRERRAVLAHERAHLEHGHHWHLSAVSLAAAANPLLTPLRDAVLQATERWADEEAAVVTGDRHLVARALAHVALLGHRPSPFPSVGLAAASHAVSLRVAALLEPPPRARPVLSLLMIGLLVLAAAATIVVGKEVEHLFELAGHVYRTTHGY